jgi:hypothetical protein
MCMQGRTTQSICEFVVVCVLMQAESIVILEWRWSQQKILARACAISELERVLPFLTAFFAFFLLPARRTFGGTAKSVPVPGPL